MSGSKLYLVHGETKRKYEVLAVDRTANTIKLKGEQATFEETYNPERFKQLGYTLVKEEA
jgi:hypothetical protein